MKKYEEINWNVALDHLLTTPGLELKLMRKINAYYSLIQKENMATFIELHILFDV